MIDKKKQRLHLLNESAIVYDHFCGNCPNETYTGTRSTTCATCPISERLQGIGEQLMGGKSFIAKSGYKGYQWTQEEEERLIKLYTEYSQTMIAEMMGITVPRITLKIREMRKDGRITPDMKMSDGRGKKKKVSDIPRPGAWKDTEISYLLDNYGKMKVYEIAEQLGRSVDSVYQRIAKMKRDGTIERKGKKCLD